MIITFYHRGFKKNEIPVLQKFDDKKWGERNMILEDALAHIHPIFTHFGKSSLNIV
ncbi:hypothetical protein ELI_2961 [Eubacterium callanderi]|uniref:Uncharacterized protein n=1 Tax=Eubacterium callanderi TaxID=53442 RepID=E3GEE4_9FIRM|nr:hypothetical protein ELI_2961 [Eubacterium callanderi]